MTGRAAPSPPLKYEWQWTWYTEYQKLVRHLHLCI
jgi:hypothetical protein